MQKIVDYMAGDRIGSLVLTGCTGLTSLPDGLSVGGSLDLQGCTGLDHLIILQRRGYTAYHHAGRIYAGCRNFTIAEARKHWANDAVILTALEGL